MSRPRPRVVALVIIWNGDRLLLTETRDPRSGQPFYRPPGGAVEFGEPAAQTVVRELVEELGVVLAGVRYFAMLESLFTYANQPEHEIVLLHTATLADASVYAQSSFPRLDDPPERRRVAVWMPLSAFAPGGSPLVPDGLYDLLASRR